MRSQKNRFQKSGSPLRNYLPQFSVIHVLPRNPRLKMPLPGSVQRLSVAFYADGHRDDEEEQERPEFGRDLGEAVSF